MIDHLKNVYTKQKQAKQLKYFWGGFITYTLSFTLSTAIISFAKIFQAFQILGLALMIPNAIWLIKYKFDSKYLKFIYTLYISWLFIIVLRGIFYLAEYSYLKVFLTNPYFGGLLYTAPLILLFPKNIAFYKKTFDVIFFLGTSYIMLSIAYFTDLISSDQKNLFSQGLVENFSFLGFSCGFLLFTYAYHSKRRQLIAGVVVSMALLFAIIRARRGLILMYGNMAIIAYIIYLLSSKSKIIILIFSTCIILLFANYIDNINDLENSRIFGYIYERGSEDTRTGVEIFFYKDMKVVDWIIGRGIRAEYYCPDIEPDQVSNYRSVIETGHLQTILNGGLLSLCLFLLIAIPAFIKGIFHSRNFLSKAAGIWILLCLINSYPSIENTFTLQYLLVWICIGICYSPEIRNIEERELKTYLLTSSR